jgi:hypothetical protein
MRVVGRRRAPARLSGEVAAGCFSESASGDPLGAPVGFGLQENRRVGESGRGFTA